MDWLGSTRYVTDSTGSTTLAAQSYDAWGQRDAQAPGSPNHPTDLQWAGSWGYQTEWSNGASEPGLRLEYLQQRYYDPALGRFISPDPLGFAAGTNLYEYADDDPVNAVDPTGQNLRKDLGDDGWKVLNDALKRGWQYEKVSGAPHPHTIWRTDSNGGKVRVHLPSGHGTSWGPDLKARVNRQIREGEAKACPTDVDLLSLFYETIFSADVLPLSFVEPGGTPFPAQSTPVLSPDGIEPDESFDLLLLGLLIDLVPPGVSTVPEPVRPPRVPLPVPDPSRTLVPAF